MMGRHRTRNVCATCVARHTRRATRCLHTCGRAAPTRAPQRARRRGACSSSGTSAMHTQLGCRRAACLAAWRNSYGRWRPRPGRFTEVGLRIRWGLLSSGNLLFAWGLMTRSTLSLATCLPLRLWALSLLGPDKRYEQRSRRPVHPSGGHARWHARSGQCGNGGVAAAPASQRHGHGGAHRGDV